jgi:hypothetical protein
MTPAATSRACLGLIPQSRRTLTWMAGRCRDRFRSCRRDTATRSVGPRPHRRRSHAADPRSGGTAAVRCGFPNRRQR